MSEYYQLPTLPYAYGDLSPFLSEELLTIHHNRHHAGYVQNTNSILEKLDGAAQGEEINIKDSLKSLSFNYGGNILHTLFWNNLAPAGGGGEVSGQFRAALEKDFGSIDRFKELFSQTASTVEGSGWAALIYCQDIDKLVPMQIEKHNVNIHPNFPIIMVLDMWEHAFYLDYKNDKGAYIARFWEFVNWGEVSKRYGGRV